MVRAAPAWVDAEPADAFSPRPPRAGGRAATTGVWYPPGVRGIFVLLHLVAAAVVLLFVLLVLICLVLGGWALWEADVGGSSAGLLLVLGAGVGYVVISVAIRVLIALRDSFVRRRRRYQADRDLPQATVVSR